ncbi:MAG: DUF3108 domain-containing protein [Flavipsychrobacter sp.]
MNNKNNYLYIFLLLISPLMLKAQDNFCGIKNTSFKVGEKLTFNVYYNMGWIWAGAGTAVFTTTLEKKSGRDVYHIVGDGRTYKSYEWFYKVRDKYETFIDTNTLLPVKFVRDVSEGGLKFYKSATFNHKDGKALTKDGLIDVPSCVQDVLSTIYYARNIDYDKYKPGDKIPFDMYLDETVYHLYIKYMGKERIKTKYGTFNSIKIKPLLIDGTMFSGGEKMSVWVSDDKNHIPLRVDSPIIVGSVKVDLMGFENLRNPFTALISKR